MNYELNGGVAVITGATQGLGLVQAKTFLDAGAKLVVTSLDAQGCINVKNELGEKNVTAYVHDMRDLKSTPKLVDTIEAEVGPIKHLVNNAGVHLKKPIWDVSDDEWENIVDINLTGLFVITREIIKKMRPRKEGTIVNISSMGGVLALPTAAGYVTTKTALLGLTRSIAVDCGPDNIRCNAVSPGFIDTEMTRKILDGDPVRAQKINGRIPMPRLGLAEDIAQTILYLSTQQSAYINGQNIPIDGGFSIGF